MKGAPDKMFGEVFVLNYLLGAEAPAPGGRKHAESPLNSRGRSYWRTRKFEGGDNEPSPGGGVTPPCVSGCGYVYGVYPGLTVLLK